MLAISTALFMLKLPALAIIDGHGPYAIQSIHYSLDINSLCSHARKANRPISVWENSWEIIKGSKWFERTDLSAFCFGNIIGLLSFTMTSKVANHETGTI